MFKKFERDSDKCARKLDDLARVMNKLHSSLRELQVTEDCPKHFAYLQMLASIYVCQAEMILYGCTDDVPPEEVTWAGMTWAEKTEAAA